MKKTIILKFYAKSLLLIVLTILAIKIIDHYSVQDELFHTTHKKFLSKNKKYDFVFMGNSLSQRTYNNILLDSAYNTESINIGGSAHHFYITNAIFQEFIDDDELYPSKLLVIEINPWQFKDFKTERLKFLQMTALDEIPYSMNYFNLINKFYKVDEYPKVLSSTIRFHNELPQTIVETKERLKLLKRIDANGFELNVKKTLTKAQKNQKKNLYKIANEYSKSVDLSKEVVMDSESEEIIVGIIDKCKEKKINVLFVTAPSISMIYNIKDFGRIKYIEKLLASKNAKHINFNRSFNTLNLTVDDFSDFAHVNKFGNRKIAPLLLNFISENFEISPNKAIDFEISANKNSQDESFILAPELVNINKWIKVRTLLTSADLDYDTNITCFRASRNTIVENAYVHAYKGKINSNRKHETSIVAKKGILGNRIGLRISGKFPNRADAVFDLQNGKLIGATTRGGFQNEFAEIQQLGDGWFKCILSAKSNSDDIKIIFGPTDSSRKVNDWEGPTETLNDVLVVPSSLTVKPLKYN